VEHRAAVFTPVADAWWAIEDGELVPGSAPVRAPAPVSELRRVSGSRPVLRVDGLAVERDRSTVVRTASLAMDSGEIVALIGPNGAGKSTVLAALALPDKGMPVVSEGRVALVPDASDDLFTRDTVGAELDAADRRVGAVRGPSAARFLRLLGGERVDPRRHPRDLSAGERRCLAITVQSAGDPQVLLIDEPTRGLDASARELVARALREAADAGTAVLFATHDADFGAALGARVLPMRDGVVPARVDAADAPVVERGSASDRDETSPREPRFNSLRSLNDPQEAPTGQPRFDRRRWLPLAALAAANLVALAAFCWPLVADALPTEAAAAVPFAALALAPLAAIAVAASLDGTVRSAHTIALLGVLAAVGAAVRIASSGVGGVEAVFILLILAGRTFGARFGLLLGVATIAISSVMWGGIGPWTPFQMFACAWVGAGAGLLPRRVRGWAEIWMLCAYGVVASYLFGLLMNLWFWPFAVGAGTGISYVPSAPIGQNLVSFLVYSLITSTLSWDTLRAITTVVGLVVIGRAVLASLRRAKPVASVVPARAQRIDAFSRAH
jgi:energy-coupling factor transport system ATP-binding protein